MLKVFFVLAIGWKWIRHSPFRVYSNPTKADKDGFDAFAFPVCDQVKCVLWGEGVNKNYLEISDDKRQLPGYLIYVHQLPKIHDQWKSPWLSRVYRMYVGDNLTTQLYKWGLQETIVKLLISQPV